MCNCHGARATALACTRRHSLRGGGSRSGQEAFWRFEGDKESTGLRRPSQETWIPSSSVILQASPPRLRFGRFFLKVLDHGSSNSSLSHAVSHGCCHWAFDGLPSKIFKLLQGPSLAKAMSKERLCIKDGFTKRLQTHFPQLEGPKVLAETGGGAECPKQAGVQ